jgi:hypothetical protein
MILNMRAPDAPLNQIGRMVRPKTRILSEGRTRFFIVPQSRDIAPLADADHFIAEQARQTSRLQHIVQHLGLALAGPPVATLAQRLRMPVSDDTLRGGGGAAGRATHVVGIDDWAWRRSQRYGAIICDLERRQILALLADRETATVQAWLTIIRGSAWSPETVAGDYGEAVNRRYQSRSR